jgi:signal transduction histidine kinase
MAVWSLLRRCGSAAIVLLLTLLECSIGFAAEPKRVMLLHSFGRDFKPWSDYARAIRLELDRQTRWPLNLHEHSLEIAQSSDERPEGPFVDYLRALFSKNRLDLIVSIGAPAAAFVQRHRQQLFPTTPMLFTVVDQRRVQYSMLTTNDTVLAVAIDYLAALQNIVRVLPETKNVMIVTGNSPIEKFWKDTIGATIRKDKLDEGIAFTWTDHLAFEDLLKRAAALPPHSAIFWELMIVDAAGVVHEEGRALARLYSVANAPIFSYTDAFFGREIVGGPQVPVLEHGRRVAEVAVRILAGEKPNEINVPPTGMGAPKFDWRELQRWGIRESRLPPGSEIYFRNPTAWEQYRGLILIFCAALLLQGGLIGWLIYEHRRRHVAEVVSRNSIAELAHMNRIATAGELSASIAHEVNQPLAAIGVYAHAGLNWLRSERPNLKEVQTALSQVLAASLQAGDIIKNLRAMFTKDTQTKRSVDVNMIISAVLALVAMEAKKHNVEIRTQLDPRLPMVTGIEIQLQQVLLNLVVNAIEAMHSVPSELRELNVRSELDAGGVRVSIKDTGPGIAPSDFQRVFEPMFTTKTRGMGMGLSICRSIIEDHKGRIWVTADSKGGSIFHFVLPTS